MGEAIELQASDGYSLGAYRARPDGTPRGGVGIIQEVFGVNGHIRGVCDGYAAEGCLAIAPALFDRCERGVERGYQGDDLTRGRELRGQLGWDEPMLDITAAIAELRAELRAELQAEIGPAGKVGAVGYCWGGSLAWLAAIRLEVDCAFLDKHVG